MRSIGARFAIVALAVAVFAGGRGFAASFRTGTSGFGADSRPVAACGSGLTFAYTAAFDPAVAGFGVDGIDISHIPAGCLRKHLSVRFYEAGGQADGSAIDVTLPSSGTTDSIRVDPSANTIDAGLVSGVSVAVS